MIVVAALVSVTARPPRRARARSDPRPVSWSLTAHAAYAAGDLRVPGLGLLALVIGALVAAVIVAAVPAWRLTRVTIAEGLRAE